MNFFIDKFDDDTCPKGGVHDDNAAVIMYKTRKGEVRYMNQAKFLGKPKKGKDGTIYYPPKRVHRRMVIVGSSVACSKCGIPYIEAHNPNFL